MMWSMCKAILCTLISHFFLFRPLYIFSYIGHEIKSIIPCASGIISALAFTERDCLMFMHYVHIPIQLRPFTHRVIISSHDVLFPLIIHALLVAITFTLSPCPPKTWNSLPLELRLAPTFDTFRRRLKTYLFG